MEKFYRHPFWAFFGTYITFMGLLIVVPSIRDFFFKDLLHTLLFIFLLLLPLIVTPLATKEVRASLLTKFRVVWHFIIRPFESTSKQWKPDQPWSYDFYEKYSEATKYRMPESLQRGSEISGRILKKALHAQPPPNGSGWYLYKVLLPEKIRRLELSLFIGIRDEVEIPIGASVSFKVKVDDAVIFSEDYGTHKWEHRAVSLKHESGREIAISFETETRGKWMGSGAMWGEPILRCIL